MQPGQTSADSVAQLCGSDLHASEGCSLANGGAKGVAKGENDAVRVRALRLLAGREHSAKELRRKLLAKGHAQPDIEQVIEQVIGELQERGLQSDRRFTEMYVRSRVGRGYGPIRIRRDLYQRGLDDELIDAELTCPAEQWVELAISVRGKRFAGEQPIDRDAWNTQARFLARRGFPADLIYRVLGQL